MEGFDIADRILPTAKALYLCDFHVGYSGGKADLYGLFEAVRPAAYPHRKDSFVCFAQLRGGLGELPFHIDICRASDASVVYYSGVRTLRFPDRTTLLKVAFTIKECVFPTPGLYLVEMYCDNTWVGDTAVELLEVES